MLIKMLLATGIVYWLPFYNLFNFMEGLLKIIKSVCERVEGRGEDEGEDSSTNS